MNAVLSYISALLSLESQFSMARKPTVGTLLFSKVLNNKGLDVAPVSGILMSIRALTDIDVGYKVGVMQHLRSLAYEIT